MMLCIPFSFGLFKMLFTAGGKAPLLSIDSFRLSDFISRLFFCLKVIVRWFSKFCFSCFVLMICELRFFAFSSILVISLFMFIISLSMLLISFCVCCCLSFSSIIVLCNFVSSTSYFFLSVIMSLRLFSFSALVVKSSIWFCVFLICS